MTVEFTFCFDGPGEMVTSVTLTREKAQRAARGFLKMINDNSSALGTERWARLVTLLSYIADGLAEQEPEIVLHMMTPTDKADLNLALEAAA
ncbi:hypothetical protein [Aliiruegeria sabulilitoris]|uniref:hypothetical protein n=1 Tax=Aliiruegeria sabulilitoris TaxID=1510458 RepID=UPI000835EBEB|nr:hypothetical protein [Aliiruegeria sabulilitoris]NDR57394.1 hypothetical protein [Pseudoruegeria sp. M32A2M]